MRAFIAIVVLATTLFGQFGIQVGAYSARPTIPAALSNLPTQIIQEGGLFKLIIGPYASEVQAGQVRNQYALQGSLRAWPTQAPIANAQPTIAIQSPTPPANNLATQPMPNAPLSGDNVYAVEILSTQDTRTIPKRIIAQVFSFGVRPVYVFDQGLYRLVAGPLDAATATQIARRLTNGFGRSIYPITLPRDRFNAATAINPPSQEELNQEALAVTSSDNNEHISFLEEQRQKAARKYYTQPYGQTVDPSGTNAPIQNAPAMPNAPITPPTGTPVDLINAPAILGFDAITRKRSGQLVGLGVTSSKNLFAVNGVLIASQYLRTAKAGYKFNDNTIITVGYTLPEQKVTLVNLAQNQRATITSSYDLMFDADLIYRYFLPSFRLVFLQADFGVATVRQRVISQVPLNFGSSYSYNSFYLQPKVGLGVGIKFLNALSLSLGMSSHFTLKSVSTSTNFYFNYEF